MKKNGTKQSPARGARPRPPAPRKAVTHAGHPLTRAKPEERAHPAERKVKHKRPAGGDE